MFGDGVQLVNTSQSGLLFLFCILPLHAVFAVVLLFLRNNYIPVLSTKK